MLQKLHIKNYAIIDDLVIQFSENMNIITGETGAGKSILMGALNLLLGQRADSSILYSKDKKCIVEGTFIPKDSLHLKEFFTNNDLDIEHEILIRREIAANGKSRSFINDIPVNLSQLKELSYFLADLHQQFDTQELASENFQCDVLDACAENTVLLQRLKKDFSDFAKTNKILEQLMLQQKQADNEADYNKFLFDELVELSLKENELEELDAELKLLNNAEHIKQQLGSICYEIKDADLPLVQQLKVLKNKMEALHPYHTGMEALSARIGIAAIEIADVADELEQIERTVLFNQERIDVINERLNIGYRLLKKHGVQDTAALLAIRNSLQEKQDAVADLAGEIKKMDNEVRLMLQSCMKIAEQISVRRQGQLKPLADKINKLLVQVGMPNAVIKIQLGKALLTAKGIDEVEFLFDANKGNRFEPLKKVASGGELSRLMLIIKSLVARKLELPTLIFDEIDSGISGEAARQVGIIMKDLSNAHQLISITHQPQIAAKAGAHYFVYKEIREDKIVTSIRLLNNDERIMAIAKMLSGEKPTAAALENAREMVGN